MAWTNSDGLRIKYGTEEATVTTVGAYNKADNNHEVELKLTLTDLVATAGTKVGATDAFTLPAGARIQRILVINETAATGTGATLNLGLQRLDRSTELDYDGLLAAAPRTDFDSAGEQKEYTVGVSGAGALVGTTLAYPGYLTADYDTAAFTAGVIRIKIFYYFP